MADLAAAHEHAHYAESHRHDEDQRGRHQPGALASREAHFLLGDHGGVDHGHGRGAVLVIDA